MVKKLRLGLLTTSAAPLSSPTRWGRLLALLALLLSGGAWAQNVSTYVATTSGGTYTPITGTLLSAASSSTTLDSYVGVIPANTIPFTFTYAGVNVSAGAVNVSSNGFLTFGTAPTTSATTPISSTTAFDGVIAPLARDLNARYSTTAGQNGEMRYSVEGTAPNREFVVQWSNFRPNTTSTTNYLVLNFQVRLAEAANVVNIVYSPDASVGTGQSGTAQVGLRGAANTDYKNFLISTTNPWNAPAPGTANTSTASYSATLLPAVGQTYTFTPPPPCSGTPTPGTAAATLTSLCVGGSTVLSLSGTTLGAGISYQWQSASSATGPFANISGATAASYTASPTQTTYYQAVVTCANGGTPVSATSNVVAVTFLSATYATIPATEGFEAAWTTACSGTNSLPSASWRNAPATGNNSWRRNDDGTSANWGSASGTYTPGGSNANGASSTYSARFHSYNASSGLLGNLDYYLNLSPAGVKRLVFDYINTSGTDKLSVFLSTDGGATFGTTALTQQVVAANWTQVAVNFTATSANCVLRFQATSDFGTTDIGLDNVSVLLAPATDVQPTALVAPAATTAASCYSSTEAVTVTVRNAGAADLSFAANPLTVTVNVTGAVTQTLTTTVSTNAANGGNPLAPGATVNITLPATLDMTILGTYTLATTATVTGDGSPANDVLGPQVRTVAAPVAGTLAPAATAICVSGTATLTLTGAANGGIQFQRSTDNVTFTDIAGATSATYTTPVLTATTYFRAQVRCNTGTATSNVSTITVNNPLVATTNTPVSICAGSTATLTATASAGSSVRFYSTATGGTALASTTAGSYTTPALTAATTYYAEAFVGGGENVGKTTSIQTDGGYSGDDTGLVFTAAGPVTIQAATVYNATSTAGSMSVELRNNTTGALIATAGPFAVAAGSSTALIPTVLPLNLAVPAAGSYRLVTAAMPSPPTLYRDFTTGNNYPFTSPSGAVTITGGYISGASSTYYFFYNLAINNECVGATRTAIQVNVTQPATATFSYPATGGNCAGSTGTVAATLATSATAGAFTSTTGLTLNATTGAVNLATSTAGTYTVTNTVAATGSCGPVTATATITVNPTPARPTLTATYNGTTTTLTSSAATGNQFYFNGVAIAGATGQTYVVNGAVATYGSYTVVVTNSAGCASPASVATVVTTTRAGIAGASLLLYPNPTPTGQVTLELSGFRSATQLAVIDALGRVVRSEMLPATTGVVTHQLNLAGTAPGVYLLRLTNADGVETRRLVRE
jgi:hypothetical protein